MDFQVRVAQTQQSFPVGPEETVLAAALRAGVLLPHECQLGGCGTCRMKVIEGAVCYVEFPMALTEEEAAQNFALACQAMPSSDLLIAPTSIDVATPAAAHRATIVSVRPFNALVTHLTLELPELDAVSFQPGQYMNVTMPNGESRSFSMASKPAGNRIDFHIRRIAGGAFTDGLVEQFRPGDALDVELPLGAFYYRPIERPLVMIATGTGLAPIKAMLESLMDDPDCPPVSLYWGARQPDDLYLHDEIGRWGERLYDFSYVPVLSRADATWTGRRGYVQDAVMADLADLGEHALYLCGSPAMIADAKPALIGRSAAPDHIHVEGFTPQRPPTPRP